VSALPSSDRARRGARRAALTIALCAGLATALTACGEDPDAGTNGVGKLSATDIEHKAQKAADTAVAVRLSGALVADKQTFKLDMRLKKTGGTGSVTIRNNTIELLRVDDTLYLKADAGFWAQGSGKEAAASSGSDSEVADKLQGKYVKVPEDDPSYKQLRGFTEMNVLLDGLLALGGDLNKSDRDRIGGVRSIKVAAGDGGAGGTLDVALEGAPYPLRVTRAGGAGTLTLSEWGKDFPLKAPSQSQTVDYGSKLPSTSD
jgi:hypothetical protein